MMDTLPAEAPRPRIACVWLPHVGIALEEREDLRRVGRPFVIVQPDEGSGAPRVLDRSYAADLCGVLPGMTLGQAQRVCPGLSAYPARPAAYREVFGALLAALQPLTGALEPGSLDLVWMEVGPDAADLAAEQESAAGILAAARRAVGIEARVALTDRRWSGQLMTRYLVGGRQAAVLPRGMDALFLGGLPVGCLGLSAGVRRKLKARGLSRMGQFAGLDGAEVDRSFGPAALRAWERLHTVEEPPLQPWQEEPWLEAGHDLGPCIRNPRSLEHHVERLAAELALGLRERYRLMARLRLELVQADGETWRQEVDHLEALGARPLALAARTCLPMLRPGGTVHTVRLAVQGICRLPRPPAAPSALRPLKAPGRAAARAGRLGTETGSLPHRRHGSQDPPDPRPWLSSGDDAAAVGSAAAD